ncbi:hypothetical protein PoB_004782900 [Plakobranchus ocellatus]|uniref:C2H2-type domain-containing protein n=1 Tax=Plakobranchus ocellatus TaxID=259542 RepID=A0AAV4BR58_9GAST|nr:hypothetical protein PoB_004782900 [Plakobranchus ocellatus]
MELTLTRPIQTSLIVQQVLPSPPNKASWPLAPSTTHTRTHTLLEMIGMLDRHSRIAPVLKGKKERKRERERNTLKFRQKPANAAKGKTRVAADIISVNRSIIYNKACLQTRLLTCDEQYPSSPYPLNTHIKPLAVAPYCDCNKTMESVTQGELYSHRVSITHIGEKAFFDERRRTVKDRLR